MNDFNFIEINARYGCLVYDLSPLRSSLSLTLDTDNLLVTKVKPAPLWDLKAKSYFSKPDIDRIFVLILTTGG